MDTYSKAVLSVIAILLCAITVKLWQPPPSNKLPTFGDLEDIRALTGQEQIDAYNKLLRQVPITDIRGSLNVNGTVDIGNTVDVTGTVSTF